MKSIHIKKYCIICISLLILIIFLSSTFIFYFSQKHLQSIEVNADSEEDYITTKTVVTQTNTVTTALTRANVWIVDYKNEYTYVAPTTTTATSVSTVDDQAYPDSPSGTGDSYSCEHIEAKRQELEEEAEKKSEQYTPDQGTPATTHHATSTVDATVKYYSKYVNIYDNITNTVESQKYIAGTPDMKEKTDKKSEEPNFVTIFNKGKYKNNKSRIKDASTWLFEIIESNDSISDMLDLIKYLLYMATGIDYGVTEFDFSIFYPGEMITVGEGDYIVDTTKSPSNIVITDLNKLKQAFSGYSNDRVLQQYAYYFLQCQEKYHVNAVFAAAVSISETSGGRAGHAIDGKNNWFNISCTCGNSSHGRFETYASVPESIERFYWQISQGGFYFTEGNYTVRTIGMIYCEDADAPGGWIENVLMYMTNMFNAAGIDVSQFIGNGGDFLEVAKECHDYVREHNFVYYNGNTIPIDENNYNGIDCSAYVTWVLYEYGYTDLAGWQQTTRTLLGLAQRKGWTVKSGSEAVAGDIMLNPNSHTSIYAGNGQFYDCGSTSLIQSEITTWNPGYQYAITVTKP